jgi:hypothetical protein
MGNQINRKRNRTNILRKIWYVYRIWGYHSSGYGELSFLLCNALQSVEKATLCYTTNDRDLQDAHKQAYPNRNKSVHYTHWDHFSINFFQYSSLLLSII